MNESLVSPELMAQIKGAFAVICCAFCVLVAAVAAFNALRRGAKETESDRQALDLGRRILDAFKGDYTMASAEVLRIRAEERIILRLAAAEERRTRMPAGASATHMQTRNLH